MHRYATFSGYIIGFKSTVKYLWMISLHWELQHWIKIIFIRLRLFLKNNCIHKSFEYITLFLSAIYLESLTMCMRCINVGINSAMVLLFWGSNDARQKLRQKWKKHHQFILRWGKFSAGEPKDGQNRIRRTKSCKK